MNEEKKDMKMYKLIYKNWDSENQLLTIDQYVQLKSQRDDIEKIIDVNKKTYNKKDFPKVVRELLTCWNENDVSRFNETIQNAPIDPAVPEAITDQGSRINYFEKFPNKLYKKHLHIEKDNFLGILKSDKQPKDKHIIYLFSKQVGNIIDSVNKKIKQILSKIALFLFLGGWVASFFFYIVIPRMLENLENMVEDGNTAIAMSQKVAELYLPFIPFVLLALFAAIFIFIKVKKWLFWNFVRKYLPNSRLFMTYQMINSLKLFGIIALAESMDIDNVTDLLKKNFFFFDNLNKKDWIIYQSLWEFINELMNTDVEKQYFEFDAISRVKKTQTKSTEQKMESFTTRKSSLAPLLEENVEKMGNVGSRFAFFIAILGTVSGLVGMWTLMTVMMTVANEMSAF